MPTGYTNRIEKGQGFEDFVMGCARAMGACVSMRDESSDTPIPEKFEPSTYHIDKLTELKTEKERILTMTDDEIEDKIEQQFNAELNRIKKRNEEMTNRRVKYLDMLRKVEKWVPPTQGHMEFKDFMIEQIQTSMKFDCYEFEDNDPNVALDVDAWRNTQLERIDDDIIYHQRGHHKELEMIDGRNKWIQDLRDSLYGK